MFGESMICENNSHCAVDHSGRRSKKNVAKCDKFREMQIYLNGKSLNANGGCEYHIRSHIRLRIVKIDQFNMCLSAHGRLVRFDNSVTGCFGGQETRICVDVAKFMYVFPYIISLTCCYVCGPYVNVLPCRSVDNVTKLDGVDFRHDLFMLWTEKQEGPPLENIDVYPRSQIG